MKIRGIDFVTIEVYGLNQSGMADLEECQGLLNENPMFSDFRVEAKQSLLFAMLF